MVYSIMYVQAYVPVAVKPRTSIGATANLIINNYATGMITVVCYFLCQSILNNFHRVQVRINVSS